jgi:hypothetical protein
MAQKHLDTRQRRIEVMSAVFTGGLGSYVGIVGTITQRPVIEWLTDWVHISEQQVAFLLVANALLWSTGIYINGRWWFSPFMRATAMVVNLCIAAIAVWAGIGSSAGYTYLWVFALLVIGTTNAVNDCRKSLIEAEKWTPHY